MCNSYCKSITSSPPYAAAAHTALRRPLERSVFTSAALPRAGVALSLVATTAPTYRNGADLQAETATCTSGQEIAGNSAYKAGRKSSLVGRNLRYLLLKQLAQQSRLVKLTVFL